jgi:hypothetical protein
VALEVGVNNPKWLKHQHYSKRQRGQFNLLHVFMIIAIVVGGAVLYQKNSFPYIHYKPDFSSVKRIFSAPVDADLYDDHLISQSSSTHTRERQQSETSERKPVKRPDESTQLTKQRYAVQAAAGYDSRHLYELRDALIQAGYPAYLVSIQTPDGIMFKLRVGAFNKREPAEALRDKLRNRYPETLSNSFVIEGA